MSEHTEDVEREASQENKVSFAVSHGFPRGEDVRALHLMEADTLNITSGGKKQILPEWH